MENTRIHAWTAFLTNSILCPLLWLMFSHKLFYLRQDFCVLLVLQLLGISRFHPNIFLAFPPEAVYDNARWVFRTYAWYCCLSQRLFGMKAFSDLLLLLIGYLRCHGVTFIKAFEAKLTWRKLSVFSNNLLKGSTQGIVALLAQSTNFCQTC